jgi:hypothetical protein
MDGEASINRRAAKGNRYIAVRIQNSREGWAM